MRSGERHGAPAVRGLDDHRMLAGAVTRLPVVRDVTLRVATGQQQDAPAGAGSRGVGWYPTPGFGHGAQGGGAGGAVAVVVTRRRIDPEVCRGGRADVVCAGGESGRRGEGARGQERVRDRRWSRAGRGRRACSPQPDARSARPPLGSPIGAVSSRATCPDEPLAEVAAAAQPQAHGAPAGAPGQRDAAADSRRPGCRAARRRGARTAGRETDPAQAQRVDARPCTDHQRVRRTELDDRPTLGAGVGWCCAGGRRQQRNDNQQAKRKAHSRGSASIRPG